jgi:hypothetical protein
VSFQPRRRRRAECGIPWFFQGAPDSRWDDDDLAQLKTIPGTAFEVVDTAPSAPVDDDARPHRPRGRTAQIGARVRAIDTDSLRLPAR